MHETQFDAPEFERNVPGLQLEQLVAPGNVLMVPAGQAVHMAAFANDLKVPGPQVVQPLELKLAW